jgi:RNA polymerase sigma factor (sigma-70 family)
MSAIDVHPEIVRRARLGDREDMNRLARLARGRVFVYIYRLTLDYDLSQDLTQETMLEMVKSLKRLNRADKFWPWLFRTALGKVQHRFRNQGSRRIERKTIVDTEKLLEYAPKDRRSGLSELIRKELSQVVLGAMGQMKLEYRNILTLRCFGQMSYSEIASLTGCSKMQAQLLFFRAKQSLKKQLSRNGFKKEYLLTALGLFGTITASATKSASAATTVNAAVAKVGLTTTLIGTVTTTSGVAITAATLTIAVAIGGGAIPRQSAVPRAAFSHSNSLVQAVDPDGDGWKGTSDDSGREPLFTIRSDSLVGYRPDNASSPLVIIPDGHILELGFSGVIVDGPGDDIQYTARTTGNYPLLFLTDGEGEQGQKYQLEAIPRIRRVGVYQVVGYDVSDLSLPFEPRALRLEGNGSRGPWAGAALFDVKARISQ